METHLRGDWDRERGTREEAGMESEALGKKPPSLFSSSANLNGGFIEFHGH
jgi:hypothetical protein